MHQSRKVRRSAKWIGNSWKFTKQMWVPTWLPIWLHIIYIMFCIHGIPWNSMVHQDHQAAKERRVRHFLHAPLAAHRAENSGSSGWNRRRGRTGGSMAWWRDRRTGIGEPWGSSHFLMGIQWLQIDKPCIALLNLLNSNGGNMRKRKCTGMYTAQDFTFHIGSESRVSKTRRWTLSNSPRWPRAAQTILIDMNWQTEMTRIRYTEAPGQPAFLEAASVLTALRHMCRNLKTLMMAVGLLEIQQLVIEMFENRVPLNPSLIIMFPMK